MHARTEIDCWCLRWFDASAPECVWQRRRTATGTREKYHLAGARASSPSINSTAGAWTFARWNACRSCLTACEPAATSAPSTT